MNETLNEMLVDLKIISMVPVDGKLYMCNGSLALEPVSILQPVRRYLSNSNRHIVSMKIKQRIMELERFLSDQTQIKEEWILFVIEELIDPVKVGISNLQSTYSTDSQILAAFELYLARLANIYNTHFLIKKQQS